MCGTFSCAPAWEDPANISYTWYLMIIGFILPLIIILYTSLNVIYNLHKVIHIKRKIFLSNLVIYRQRLVKLR